MQHQDNKPLTAREHAMLNIIEDLILYAEHSNIRGLTNADMQKLRNAQKQYAEWYLLVKSTF